MITPYWPNDGIVLDEQGNPTPECDTRPLAAKMLRLINGFAGHLDVTGKRDRMRRSACLIYGVDPDSSRRSTDITYAGDTGNVIQLRANVMRRLTEDTHVLITGSRPAWTAGVSSSDSQATDAIPIVNELLDHALTRLGAEAAVVRAAWNALVFAEGHVSVRWDELVGDPIDVSEDGRVDRTGEVLVQAHRPDEVVRDWRLGEQTPNDWIILVSQMNRYDLAELYPDYADDIVNCSLRTDLDDVRESLVYGVSDVDQGSERDQVTVYELFHRESPSVPHGRYALMVGATIVSVGWNKYGDLPIYSMIPDREPAQAFGYSSGWDLMAMQQAVDSTLTSIVSTTENLGQPGIWAGMGSDVGVEMIGGFKFVKTPSKPEPLQYVDPNSLAVLSGALNELTQLMTSQSGLNSVARGDAASSASGDALAMMHSLAIQSTSRLQASYADMFAACMLGIIRRYRTFATDERVISITGKGSRARVKRWTGSDLAAIDAIKVEMRAAIMRTASGRQAVAKEWLMQGLIKTPEQYMQALTTGSLTPITHQPPSERALIEHENEVMTEGTQAPIIAATHCHALHILEHSVLLLDPDLLADPMRTQAVTAHIQEHTMMWGQMSQAAPDLLIALGQQLAPSMQMMMGAQAAQAQANPAGDPNAPKGEQEPAPPNQPAKLEEANIPPGGGMDAGNNQELTGGGRLPTGTGNPVMA